MATARQPDSETVHIGPMFLADVDGVLEVERLAFPTPWSRQAFQTELTQNPYAHYLAARCGGRVVGYAGMWVLFDEAHVTNVAVHPEYRGRKVGECLMLELIAIGARRGATRMTLEVRPSNHVAQNLYAKLGFAPGGLRPGYYTDTGEDAIIMWKEGLRQPG